MTIIRASILSLFFSAILAQSVSAQSVYVSGKVTEPGGKPVGFASIRVKNAGQGVSSDTLGGFRVRVRPGDSLVISAIGFSDTTLATTGKGFLVVTLARRAAALGTAVVTEPGQQQGLPSPEQAVREQVIMSAFQEYLTGAEFSNGAYLVNTAGPSGSLSSTKLIAGVGPLNTLNAGAMLPVVTHQEDTRGSRYLLKHYARGVVVDKDGHIMADSLNLLNYDKIDGQLMIAQTARTYLEVDKEKVVAFALRDQDSAYIFLNVPALSKVNYFLLVATGPRYSVYKSIRTKFVKANYQSNGLIETGNNYDEYVDKQSYFWVDAQGRAGIFELKKKSILEALSDEKAKTGAYFAKHKYDDVDEGFVRNLINYLNAPADGTQP
jgi:hypothetical protein